MELLKNSSYYAKPDGQDYTGKMIATNRFILMGAIPMATADALMYSHCKGYLQTMACFAKWIGPSMGMASAFTTGTYAAYHLRGKDDCFNYVIGACGAAGIFGKALRSPQVGIQMCILFSLAGMIKKISVQEGWTFYPTVEQWENNRVYGSLRTSQYDFTIVKDTKEKGWTTGRD